MIAFLVLLLTFCPQYTDAFWKDMTVYKLAVKMGLSSSRLNLPIPSGSYSVGTADIMTELSINGCFIRLYYPTEYLDISTRQVQFPPWLPREEYLAGYADFLNLPFKKFRFAYNWKVGNVFIPALWHFPLASSTVQHANDKGAQQPQLKRFPLVIFSHGLGANRTAYSTICCDIASHGFIVAAVEHRDKSACFSYFYKEIENENGYSMLEEIPIKYRAIGPDEKEFPIRNRQVHQRVTECIQALHLMEAIHLGKDVDKIVDQKFDLSMFKDRIDLNRVGIMGHSFGGATVIGALAATTDFRVGLVLDGWMFPLENNIYSSVTQPLLFVNSELFQWKDNIKRMMRLESSQVDRPMVTLRGSVHQSQTDFTFMLKGWLAMRLQSRGTTDPYLCNEINNALCVTFLRKHLNMPCQPSFVDVLAHYKDWVLNGTNVNIDETRSQL